MIVEHEVADTVVELGSPVAVVGMGQGSLVGPTRQVRVRHERVGPVDDRWLGRAPEQLAWVGHQPLVELVLPRDQHHDARIGAPPHPAGLLPQRRDRSGEPVEDTGVETADVDPELQRRGGDHAAEQAAGEQVLDLASLLGEVPRPVGSHGVGQLVRQPGRDVAGDELGALAAAAERDRAVAGLDQPRGDRRGLRVRRGASPRCARRPPAG